MEYALLTASHEVPLPAVRDRTSAAAGVLAALQAWAAQPASAQKLAVALSGGYSEQELLRGAACLSEADR